MAGIGFDLRAALDPSAGAIARTRAWAAAGLISSGPWIATIFVLSYLQLMAPFLATEEDFALFRGLVTWCFAFSLLVVSVFQMPVTRRLADQLWVGDRASALPGLVATLALVGAIQLFVGGVFVRFLDLRPLEATLAVALYLACSWTWVSLVWLGVSRDYVSVLRAYAIGGGLTILLSLVPVVRTGLAGLLAIFGAGQALTLLLVLRSVLPHLGRSNARCAGALGGMVRFPTLLFVGALYGVGMWADKFVFWLVHGVELRGPLHHHPLYDASSFLAYATVIPALAIHLVRTETQFYERYRGYYDSILNDASLGEIRRAREGMFASLRASVLRLVRLQAWVSLAAIVLAPRLLETLGMPPAAVPVFRVLAVGAYFHVLFLLTLLVLLYFDRQRAALVCVAVFCALNVTLPWISALGDPSAYGVGYAVACLGGLVVGFTLLQRDLGRLEYLTFSRELGRTPEAEAPVGEPAVEVS